MSCNYGCATLPDHQQVACNDYSNGGISAIGVLECDYATNITDFSNASQWTAAIAAGRAKILKSIKGEIPDAAPANIDNPVGCGAQQIMIGQDTTLNWTDANVLAGNDDFYAKLNLRRVYLVAFFCEEGQIRVSSDPATVSARGVMVPGDNRQIQMYNISASFFSKTGEIPFALYTAPAGIFE